MPRGYRKVDLSTWKDKRAADGTTIIARMDGQATPAMYPGIIPENPDKDIQLFNLKKDPGESLDLSGENPELVEDLMQELELFKNSINH